MALVYCIQRSLSSHRRPVRKASHTRSLPADLHRDALPRQHVRGCGRFKVGGQQRQAGRSLSPAGSGQRGCSRWPNLCGPGKAHGIDSNPVAAAVGGCAMHTAENGICGDEIRVAVKRFVDDGLRRSGDPMPRVRRWTATVIIESNRSFTSTSASSREGSHRP